MISRVDQPSAYQLQARNDFLDYKSRKSGLCSSNSLISQLPSYILHKLTLWTINYVTGKESLKSFCGGMYFTWKVH